METESGWPPWVEQWVMPFMEESGLWPVLAALIGHVVVIIAPLILVVARGGLPAALPLALIMVSSGWLCFADFRRKNRFGAVTVTVVIVWITSVMLAVVADQTGVF